MFLYRLRTFSRAKENSSEAADENMLRINQCRLNKCNKNKKNRKYAIEKYYGVMS